MHITSVGLRAWGTKGLRSRERRQACHEQCKRSVCVCAGYLVRGSTCAARVIGWRWCVCACVRVAIVTDAQVRPNPCHGASPRLQQHAMCARVRDCGRCGWPECVGHCMHARGWLCDRAATGAPARVARRPPRGHGRTPSRRHPCSCCCCDHCGNRYCYPA